MAAATRKPKANDPSAEQESAFAATGMQEEVMLQPSERRDYSSILEGYESPRPANRYDPDMLDGRFRIEIRQPLPQLDAGFGKAYAVTDLEDGRTDLYAMVLSNRLPYRMQPIERLKTVKHPNITNIVAAGTVNVSSLGECRFTVVQERPRGIPLSRLLQGEGKGIAELFLINEILKPIHGALALFAQLDVCHCRLNLDNVYYDESSDIKLMLGEMISAPAGYGQNYHYEMLERALCHPLGKGKGDGSADFYAVGVMALILTLGFNPVENMDEETYLHQRLNMGSYHTLLQLREFSDVLSDLFRGLLNDNKHERWTHEQLGVWLDGKRFNLIHPSVPKEAVRPFEFAGKEYFNRRALANGLHKDWNAARVALRDSKLARWVELSVLKPDVAEELRIAQKTGGSGDSNIEDDELVARSIITLDPTGPLRLRGFSASVDGLGTLLAEYYRNKQHDDITLAVRVVRSGLPEFWSDRQAAGLSDYTSMALWRMQKIRNHLGSNNAGYGIERCLYDLTPAFPCHSPLVLKDHIMSLEELLYILDAKAKDRAQTDDPVDRHISAFVASRLEILRPVKITEFERFPKFRDHPVLQATFLLAKAQKRIGNPRLRGLAYWICVRLDTVIDLVHSRAIRKQLSNQLRKVGQSGVLERIMVLLSNSQLASQDMQGFEAAQKSYKKNAAKIQYYLDEKKNRLRAKNAGGQFATAIAYTICALTLVALLNSNY